MKHRLSRGHMTDMLSNTEVLEFVLMFHTHVQHFPNDLIIRSFLGTCVVRVIRTEFSISQCSFLASRAPQKLAVFCELFCDADNI
jgi:hypothetical protein